MSTQRNGILAGGNWIIDRIKVIDHYPKEDGLALILEETANNGGSPYNLLKDLSLLGAPFTLSGVGLIGDDENGETILQDCREHGILTGQLHRTAERATSYTNVMTVFDTGRRTFFHQKGANALLDRHHFDLRASSARIFHLGYLLLLDLLDKIDEKGSTSGARLLEEASRQGFVTSVDVVSENSDRFSDVVLPVLPFTDILTVNEYEAGKITHSQLRSESGIRINTVTAAAKKLLEAGVRQWALIHFPEGALAMNRKGDTIFQPSLLIPESKIKGAVGAGDAFAAGILYGQHEEWTMEDSLHLGICAAAACLFDSSASNGILSVKMCRELEEQYGLRPSL